jgi:hypothetical protein
MRESEKKSADVEKVEVPKAPVVGDEKTIRRASAPTGEALLVNKKRHLEDLQKNLEKLQISTNDEITKKRKGRKMKFLSIKL